MTQSSTFILIHGANLGGWCWRDVQSALTAHGHDVLTPSLDLSLGASLSAHIDGIADLILTHDLYDVILVGHSYGGMVITGVADRVKERVARLVYLDAAVPKDGDDFASHVPGLSELEAEERRDFYRSLASDGVWLPPPPLQLVGIVDAQAIADTAPRLMPHPLATWLQPVHLLNGGAAGIPKTYVLAVSPPTDIMGYSRHGETAKHGSEWTYREVHSGHAMMLTAPEETAELLLEAAAQN